MPSELDRLGIELFNNIKEENQYKNKIMEIITTYYDRIMCDELVQHITQELDWLIPFVKRHESLDFQTGHDPKQNRSWFSIYRGTGRIFQVLFRKGKFAGYKAADKYMRLDEEFFSSPSPSLFEKYLSKIEAEKEFDRYYIATDGTHKEGYYQTLIGRRYTFNYQESDDFIIIDKEFVIGFKDEVIKTEWNKDIVYDQQKNITVLRSTYEGKLPKDIKAEYGEFDFLGLNKNGDILIMELKQDAPAKTALSPIQTVYYYKQLSKLLSGDNLLYERIKTMVEQKINMGLISKSFLRYFPSKLSNKIIPCVIYGKDSKLSKSICERYCFVRDLFLPSMKAFTCDEKGTILTSKK